MCKDSWTTSLFSLLLYSVAHGLGETYFVMHKFSIDILVKHMFIKKLQIRPIRSKILWYDIYLSHLTNMSDAK